MKSYKSAVLLLIGMFLPIFTQPVLAKVKTDTKTLASSVETKRSLPLCARDWFLAKRLSEIGEELVGVGEENSKLATLRNGLGIVFMLNPKTGTWSVLSIDNISAFGFDSETRISSFDKHIHKTCLVAMGLRWQWITKAELKRIVPGNASTKQVGFSASWQKIKEEMSKEGKWEIGYGDQDVDLSDNILSKLTTHLFIDGDGSLVAVTTMLYKDGREISSIDAMVEKWIFSEPYGNHK
ncbi:MAG: hypothetical protein HYT94_01695 [Parcubacteria group bacterium]|nr:hypothetical protein [Parcubacteria group bacterium]